MKLEPLIDDFVCQSQNILGKNLVGCYLHGSAAMGCFYSKNSDLDLIIVVKESLLDSVKRTYMDMVVTLNKYAPQKGIEFSIVKESVCRPFIYPTPFELHFSIAHLNWYQTNPDEYIKKMKGTDKDLAAHFTILYHRGKTLFGKAIHEVFSEVSRENYFDSIWGDIANAKEEIIKNPVYITLNLCRVLAYCREEQILSKLEGGNWGLRNLPEKYTGFISEALEEYKGNQPIKLDKAFAKVYAEYMLEQIQHNFI